MDVRKHFNVNKNEYFQLLEEQNGVCSICGNKPNDREFDLDHCHINNLARGLLCRKCNLALGLFEDNKELLQKAIDYIDCWDDIHKGEFYEDT